MGAPYSSVTVSGYNANPPSDDGAATLANEILWATIKSKLPDPLNTAIAAINANLITAFAKVLGGSGVTSTATDYQVQGSDQGKLVRATAAAVTLTTPDATSVLSPFVFAVLNNSSGTITLDGSGTQTIDGSLTITVPAGGGAILFTDGTNWFTNGIQGTLVGKQLGYSDVINGTLVESNGANAVTFALKTLAGSDPSSADPVLLCFRNGTAGTGNYVYRQVTAALSLVISSGSTLGFANATAGKVWIVLFDDAGTIRMGAINCVSGTGIYPLGQFPIASSTAEGGAGAADSAQVFYTGTAVSSKAYIPFAFVSYETGITTAGSWNASPTRIQLYGRGIKLPGDTIQVQRNATGTVATGTTAIPLDNTIPQSNEGDQYMSQAITPTSASNILRVRGFAASVANAASARITASLIQDSTANAIAAAMTSSGTSGVEAQVAVEAELLAATTSSTTFKLRMGAASGTTTFNGSAGTQTNGGVLCSYMRVEEVMT